MDKQIIRIAKKGIVGIYQKQTLYFTIPIRAHLHDQIKQQLRLRMRNKIMILLLLIALPITAQWKNETVEYDSQTREYRIYVPTGYEASKPASLVFALHGLTETMTGFSEKIAIENIADRENSIVVCPQGLERSPFQITGWNSGATFAVLDINFYNDIDDVGFIRLLIDKFSTEYAINSKNIFAFGYSMGGFMTQRLALELSDKIQSFASVAGTIGNGIVPIAAGTPGRPVSIAHFHGTDDEVVGYDVNDFGLNVQELINFWRAHNLGGLNPEHYVFPDIAADNMTVERYTYTSNFNTAEVVLFKVNNGSHEKWLKNEQNDISYTEEIWKFFKKTSTLANPSLEVLKTELLVYPNPLTGNQLNIRLTGQQQYENQGCSIVVYDASGRKIIQEQCDIIAGNGTINVRDLPKKGMYWVEVTGNGERFKEYKKLLINR